MIEKSDKSILKLNWERQGSPEQLSKEQIEAALRPYTSENLESFEGLSQGCRNTNYKICLKNAEKILTYRGPKIDISRTNGQLRNETF